MPYGDGLGPRWNGYGRGMWGYGRGYGWGCYGRGYGRGGYFGGGYGAPYPSVEDEKAYLEYRKHLLEEDLKYINDRLNLLGDKES